MKKQPGNTTVEKFGLGIAFFMFLAVGLFSWMIWQQADQGLRAELLSQAQRSADAINLDYLNALSGTPDDQQLPEYAYLKRQLMLTRQIFPESRFLYLMGQKSDGTVFFFVDSEQPGTEDESLPGDSYTDLTYPLLQAISGKAGTDGPVRDEWGTWVSGLTPISDPHSGEVLAVFGMDVDAGKWNQLVVAQIRTPLTLAGLLVLGILTSIALLRWRASISPRQYEKWHLNKAEVVIVFVLGLIVTSLIAWIAHTNEERSRQETFERLAAIRAGYITKNFNDLEKYHLEGLANFFDASQFVDRQEFIIYTSALANDPTVQAWEWVPAVDFAELPQMISDARQDGLADFVIWEFDEHGQRRPVLGGREMLYPVLYAAPLDGNYDALGYDLGSELVRRAAIERALSSGLTTASGPISLVQELETQLGILVLRPVYPNAAINTQSGFVAAALRMETLLQSALGPIVGLGSSVYLDLYYVELGSAPTFLAGNAPEDIVAAHILGELHSHPYADLTYIQPVHAFGQVFALVLHPGPVFNQIYPLQAGWLTALFGILLSTLLAVLTYVLVSRREMLTQQVAERTAELAESETDYRELFEAESDAIFLIDNQTGNILQANRAASLLYGYTHEDLLTLKNTDLSAEPEQTRKTTEENPLDPDRIVMIPLRWHKRKDATVFPVEITARLFERKGRSVHIAAIRDISQRKKAEATLLLQSTALHSAANAIVITDHQGRIEWANPAFSTLTGYGLEEAVGKKPGDLLKSGAHDRPFYQQMWDTIVSGETWTGQMLNRKKDGSLYNEEMTITPVKTGSDEITHFIAIKQDISERKKREHELETLATVSGALRSASTRADMLTVILDHLVTLLNSDGAALVMRDTHTGESVLEAARGEFMEGLRERLPPGVGAFGRVIESGKPFVTQDISKEEGVIWSSVFEVVHALAGVPMIVETQVIGALWIGRKGHINSAEIRLLTSIADIAANAIYRETSREETIQQLQRLATLRSIDQLITGGLDLQVILKYIVDQVSTHLKIDAVGVLLFNPHILQLEFADGIGFRTPEIESTTLRIGEGMAGAVASEQKTLYLPDLASSKFAQTAIILREGFVSYFATPLIVKGQVKGVLEVFHRTRIDPGPAWVNFFELLAGQTAIAIDNAQLFEGLQHSNLELTLAYDETIEGWSRAMDLRDTDTEGHTQRVTELTITLAKLAGISDSEIVHIRRGALLHDMGKLGVPDSILLKSGPLTDEEWEIMHRHPLQAYQMLAPIAYLRPALDIPYCHHEKWDGTGYPRGLKGEQIPLAARIFAVVDVYDALISDRPYRPAWSKEEALAYIRAECGKHFDPAVVECFLEILISPT